MQAADLVKAAAIRLPLRLLVASLADAHRRPSGPAAVLARYIDSRRGPVAGSSLRSISQDGDDYDRGSDSRLAAMTDSVVEALAAHRLVVANYPLLMSRPDEFEDSTLLIIDEAQALEQEVTGAGSVVVEYQLLENLAADLRRRADEQ